MSLVTNFFFFERSCHQFLSLGLDPSKLLFRDLKVALATRVQCSRNHIRCKIGIFTTSKPFNIGVGSVHEVLILLLFVSSILVFPAVHKCSNAVMFPSFFQASPFTALLASLGGGVGEIIRSIGSY